MDKATSMFDPEGEASFIMEWGVMLVNKVVISIAHQETDLGLADRVLEEAAENRGMDSQ
jgi:ATP-binding cassette subfamily B protein/subfamily B ATP-binding cassette protein MsbA